MRRPPMSAEEARENIAEMRLHTNPRAMRRLLTLALGPLGNLSDEARTIYQAEIDWCAG